MTPCVDVGVPYGVVGVGKEGSGSVVVGWGNGGGGGGGYDGS